MPGYKKHLYFSVLFYLITIFIICFFKVGFANSIFWLLFTLAGSLFPDIDIKSKGQKLFYLIGFFIFLGLICLDLFGEALLIAVFSFLPVLARHRGVFHNPFFLFYSICLISLLIYSYFPNSGKFIFLNAIFFFVGCMSHLLLDFFKIKLFFPKFTKKKRGH